MKSISKSIRLTDKVYDYILNYKGSGFNEKFENIILDAMESETERKESIKLLDLEIKQKEEKLLKLDQEIVNMKNLTVDVRDILLRIDRLKNVVNRCQEV